MRPLVTPRNPRLRFWKRFTLASLCGVVSLLLLLPTLLTQLIRYQVPRMGLGTVEIGNLDLNLFRGIVRLEEVALYNTAARVFSLERMELDLSMLSLLEHRFYIQSLTLQGLSLTLRQDAHQPLRIAGVALPQASSSNASAVAEQGSDWGFGFDSVDIRDSAFLIIHPKFSETLQLTHLSVGALATWRPEFITSVDLGMSLREATLRVTAKSSPFNIKPVHQFELVMESLPLASLSRLMEPALTDLQGTVSTRMRLELQATAAQSLVLQQQGELSVTDLSLQSGDSQLSQQGMFWDGSVRLADVADSETLAVNGELTLSGIGLRDSGGQDTALSLHKLVLGDLRLTGSKHLAVGEVTVDGLVAEAVRHNSGIAVTGLPETIATAEDETAVDNPQPADARTQGVPFAMSIERIRMRGENRITFDDQTVKPPFRHTISITEAMLQHIDSSKPEQAMAVMVKGKDDYYSSFSVEGAVKPFAPQLSLDLKSRLNDFDLPPTSPYLAQLLGYRVTTGQLDTQVTMQIDHNEMKGEVELRMNQLQLEQEDPARSEEFQSKTTLPLNTALSLLRDSNDNIKLRLPIRGRLDDPQFDLHDIINTALATALKSASVSYLKLLLQPYGTLISVIQMAGKAAGHIKLEAVLFTAGSAEVSPDATRYVEKLSTLLEKKSITMQLCGYASVADLAVITKGKEKVLPASGHPALESLARQRAENIKSVLVTSYGVLPKQLFICHPELDASEGATPRVELSI